jgi:outer membrane protein assembly factor BamB
MSNARILAQLACFSLLAAGVVASPGGDTPKTPGATRLAEPGVLTDPLLSWHWTPFGDGIGDAGLRVEDLDGDGSLEIVASAGSYTSGDSEYFYILSADGTGFTQTWSSLPFEEPLTALAVYSAGVGESALILVATGTRVVVFDPVSEKVENVFAPGATTAIVDVEAGDVDADGAPEIVLCTETDLYVLDLASGEIELLKPGFGGLDLAIGQADADSQLEIAIAGDSGAGFLIDGSSGSVEWERASGFGELVLLADLAGSDHAELVTGHPWTDGITVFDIGADTELYSFPIFNLAAIAAADVHANAGLELVYGDAQWGSIYILDGEDGSELWSVENPEHGVTEISIGDVDGDDTEEILWGAGHSSTGPDHLFSADTQVEDIEWASSDLRGPFYGLDHGDIDADGSLELLWTTFESNSGRDDGLYLVHDALTLELEHVSEEATGFATGVWRTAVANLDDDPQLEICLTTDVLNAGRISCFDGLTHEEEWHSAIPNGLVFKSLTIVDVDGDSRLEVVAGTAVQHTGAPGVHVYAFDGETGAVDWTSPDLGDGFVELTLLRVADVDGDTELEVVVGHEPEELAILDGATGLVELPLTPLEITALETADLDANGTAEIYVGTVEGLLQQIDPTSGAPLATLGDFEGPIYGLDVSDLAPGESPSAHFTFVTRGRLTTLDATSLSVDWQSAFVGSEAAASDSLLVADVDGDAETEIMLNTGAGVAILQTPTVVRFAGDFESGDTTQWDEAVGEHAAFLEVTAKAAFTGSFGLRVTVGGSCEAPDELDIVDPPLIEGDFVACKTIRASGVQVTGAGATFGAGLSIELDNGFSVADGAPFSAVVDPGLSSGLAYVEDQSPESADSYNAFFRLRLDDLTLADLDRPRVLVGYDADGTRLFGVTLRWNSISAEHELLLSVRQDNGPWITTAPGDEMPLVAGWNAIQIQWLAGAGSGSLTASVNGAPPDGLLDVDNAAQSVESARLGYLGGAASATPGSLDLDAYTSWP